MLLTVKRPCSRLVADMLLPIQRCRIDQLIQGLRVDVTMFVAHTEQKSGADWTPIYEGI